MLFHSIPKSTLHSGNDSLLRSLRRGAGNWNFRNSRPRLLFLWWAELGAKRRIIVYAQIRTRRHTHTQAHSHRQVDIYRYKEINSHRQTHTHKYAHTQTNTRVRTGRHIHTQTDAHRLADTRIERHRQTHTHTSTPVSAVCLPSVCSFTYPSI